MGGKRKQAQRTKNNVKPSSSSRSAELLGSSISQFVGFSGVKDGSLILSGFSLPTDDLDSIVDSNFQLVFKKMNKKDATTKLKALQEFAELCKSAEPDVIKTILPFWPRLYCSLATDSDHKVREAAHVAHVEVVQKAKKNLAPHLKQLVGAWFTSQYDTYPPAATAATKAFETAFSNKLNNAIAFCQEEILSYIYDNIIVQTAQTLSSLKTSPEDADARYHRVLVSSLQGYALYLKKVSSEEIEKASEHNAKIITNQKFWKLAKNKISSIRAAWFAVMSALCQKAPFLLENEDAHVTGAIFGNFDEGDPAVLRSLWEAVLCTMTTVKEWWKYINVEKVVLNKLWKILREGGHGNASVIYPNLLPLLSHLPPVGDMNTFYSTFFENLRAGLKYKTVIVSRSEAVAVSTAFVECLQFVILRNQNDVALCERLIKTQLMPSVEWALTEPQASHKTLFNQISTVVQYWGRNTDNEDVPHYKHYLQYFWSNLDALFQGLLINLEQNFEKNAISDFASRQIELLQSLKYIAKSKKQMKVSFSKEEAEHCEQRSPESCSFSEAYLKALENLVLKVCKSYVTFINEKKSKELIQYLYILLKDFESHAVFEFLNSQSESKNLIDIYENLLAQWLKDDKLCSVYVIDLIFLLLKYTNDAEKDKILQSFLELPNKEIFSWCIKKMLSFPHKECPVLQRWLRREEIGKFFVDISRKILNNSCPSDLDLILKQAFEENGTGELFIAKNAVQEIIGIFSKALLLPLEFSLTLDTCVRFSAHIAGAIYNDSYKLSYGDGLLLAIFKLSCCAHGVNETLSKDTIWEIGNVWQDVIAMLCRELTLDEFKSLTEKCANIIEELILKHQNKEDYNLEFVVDTIVSFVKSVHSSNALRISDIVHIFLKRGFLSKCEEAMTFLCKKAEYIKGSLSCPYKELEAFKIDSDTNIGIYFTWNHLVANILMSPLPNDDDDDSDDEDGAKNEEHREEDLKIISYLSEAEVFVVKNIYGISLAQSFIENYKNTKYYAKVMQQYTSIKQQLTALIKNSKKEFVIQVEDAICRKALREGWIWAQAAHLFYSTLLPRPLTSIYVEMIEKYQDEIVSEISALHLGQIFSHSLNYDYVKYDLMPIESIICLRNLLHCNEIDVQVAEVLAKVDKYKAEKQKNFLLESADSLTWEELQFTIEVIRLFSSIIQKKKDVLTSTRWDFVVVAFTTWLENLVKMESRFSEIQVEALIAALSDLFVSLRKHLLWLEEYAPNAAKSTLDEWKDLFACDVHRFIIELWLHFIDHYQDVSSISLEHLPLLQEFGRSLQYLDHRYLFNKRDVNTCKWHKIIEKCCPLLTHPLNTLQLWAYHMLLVLLPGLVEIDSNSVNTNTPHATGLTIEHFKDVLVHTEEIVHSMLIEFKLGEDSCTVQPFTDSYTYTFAYLLLWDILLNLCSQSSTELRYQYADWIKNNDFLTKLLNNVFRLMPSEVLHQSNTKMKPFANFFLERFPTDFTESFLSLYIEHMVCWIYTQTLSQLPALVRQWWSVTETKVTQIVDRVTSVYVSPTLCSQELTDVIQHEKKFKNMTVKIYPNVREVVAVYTVDEAQMELLITLPPNYPLKVPDIQCNRQICGTSHRQWLLQLKTNVLHQNGRIWDGLSLWNNNLDKKFDGVEECCICFAVLHQGTYQLPKLSCGTCRKKFHSACLYKWFSTSNKSTCPICRNLF